MIDIKLLEQLCLCNGISGDEGNVRNLIINEIKDCADNLGNLIVFKKGKKSAKSKLMVSAHMDEVGLMVTDITSDGYLKFDEVGGIDRRVLPGKRVCVGRNGLNGVIGLKPIHLTNGDEKTAVPKMSDMYIDIGAESREDALKYVNYGDGINFEGDFNPPYKKNFGKKKSESERKKERSESIMTAFTAEENNGQADINDIATYLGVTEKTVRNRLKEHGGFWIDGGKTGLKEKEKVE